MLELGFEPQLKPSFEARGYVLVVPDGQQKYDSEWQVEPLNAQEDLVFFVDVLRCLWEQVPIELRRVHSMGFSVGARYSDYLLGRRSNRVASVVTWSAGERTPQNLVVVPVPPHATPTLMYHGGDGDTSACCGKAATLALVARLKPNGNFMLVCDHGGGHGFPPQPGRVNDLWRFIEQHPFMAGSEAAWRGNLPAGLPAFCAVP